MADLAFGLSKTVVQLLADKVKSAIKEEAEQWMIVERDLVFITGELEMMQAFLNTADEERVKNKILRTWVAQVRDLSCDVEDCIEFVIHLDTTNKSWWLRLMPSSFCGKRGPELPVDQAVAETTQLRARVVDVSKRNIRYNLIVDSASKPMAAMDPVKKTVVSSFEVLTNPVENSGPLHPSRSMDLVQKTAASSFDGLINAVENRGHLDLAGLVPREDRDLHVVSVCGTEGGLVEVAIVREMYSDARVSKQFECRAWVKLMHPFNPHEFIMSMMTQFLTQSCQEEDVIVGVDTVERMQQVTQGELINEFARRVNTHRYLIVLENLCNMVEWDTIRSYLPDRKKGSRIVLLTDHPVVASLCIGEPCRVSELGQFSQGHSVCVYYKEGFQGVHSFIKAEPYNLLFNYGLLGHDTKMDELFEKIQESRLVSVWGMPGVGKSALVEAIYRKLRTSDDFKSHAWVKVSHPFSPADFSRSLLADLHSESTQAFRAEDPIKECRDHLCDFVCLLVIEGVQSNEEWDWIKSNLIQYGDYRSYIVIITKCCQTL